MDEATFTRYAESERYGLAAFFGRRGVPVDDMEELIQESLLTLWRARQRVQVGRERSFLFGIAHRLLMAYYRKQQKLGLALLEALYEEGAVPEPVTTDTALAFSRLLAREEVNRVRKAVNQLPPRQREVIRTVYFEGYTKADAARQLHISRESIHTHHRRALQRLGELLAVEREE